MLKYELLKEADRVEEDALFSSKGHYNAVLVWQWTHRLLGIVAAVGSALAATAVLRGWGRDLAIGFAALSTVVSVVLTTLKPNELSERHQRAGDRYLAIKNRIRIFRNIDLLNADATADDAVAEIKSISEELAVTASGAPVIPRRAYNKAKREIEVERSAIYKADQT